MKFKLASLGLCIALTAFGYTATPSEFPSTFIKQAQQVVDHAVEEVKDQSDLHAIISPIAGMDNYASLKTVRRQLAELEQLTMSDSLNTHIDAMRLAGLFKLSVPLILRLNDRILDALSDIEHLIFFWKEAHEYRVQFFLHRKSPKVIVNELQLIQQELCTLLGSLVQLVNRAPFGHDHARQYAWFDDMYGLFHMQEPSESSASVSLVFETVAAMLTRATNFVLGFSAQMDKRLYEYSKPSWVRRHLGSAVTTLVGGAAAVASAHQCKDAHGDRYVEKAAENIGRHATMYRDACINAVWGDENEWTDYIEKKEKFITNFYTIIASRILPSLAKTDVERDRIAGQLVQQRLRELGISTGPAIDLSRVQKKANGELYIGDSTAHVAASAGAGAVDSNETDIERVFSWLFGASLPERRTSSSRIHAQREAPFTASTLDLSTPDHTHRAASPYTVEAMNQAAKELDLDYLGTLIFDPLSVEGQQAKEAIHKVMGIIGETDLGEGNNVRRTLHQAFPSLFNPPSKGDYTYDGYSAAIGAAAEKLKDNLGVLDTITQLPEVGILGWNVTRVKLERKVLETCKKGKMLFMISVSYFLYRVGKDMLVPPIRYLLKKTKILAYPHEELFETLRELKKLLLVNGERQQSEMEPCDLGLLYYLIYRLECVDVPAKYSASFLNDVRLLQSPDLSAKQKYKVVKDVLQNGYPFLRHTAVKTK